MLLDVCLEKMRGAAEDAAERLRAEGLTVKVELDYMNAFFKTVDTPKRAKFVTVTVVISAEETPAGDEYCLSLGAEIRGGKVDEMIFEKDLGSFSEMLEETVTRLREFRNKSEGVSLLANEASAEYDKLVEKLTEDQKKQRVVSAIGLALTVIGIIILFVVATVGGLSGT